MPSLLLKGGTVATFVEGSTGPKTFKADVLVEGNTITRIGEALDVDNAEVIDCRDKWITPGMVDTHRHVWMTVLRASQCDWLLTEYLVKQSWTIQGAVTTEDVRIGTLAGYLDALHNGVTTVLDHFHAAWTPEGAEAALAATIESGARAVWCPARQSAPTRLLPRLEFANEAATAEWQTAKLREWGQRLAPGGRVTLGLAYDGTFQGDMKTHKEYLDFARSIPVSLITAHVVKGPQILTWRDGGLLGPDVVFSHCNLLVDGIERGEEMWNTMRQSGASIASTPEDEPGMAHGNPVAFEALKRGVKVGLGVDTTSINGGDMFTAMRFALQFARGQSNEHILKNKLTSPFHHEPHMNSANAFYLATLAGARALNLSHLIGSVEVGKRADLLVFDATSVNLAGAGDPFNGIVFHAASEDIELVMVDGNIVKKDRKLVREWVPVARELRASADRLRERFPAEKLEETWKAWYEANGAPVI